MKPDRKKESKIDGNKKTEFDNQWISTSLDDYPDERERRDGPGGEDADI